MQLWVWVCIGAHKGQNSVLDLLESDSYVQPDVYAGNRTWSSKRATSTLTYEPFLHSEKLITSHHFFMCVDVCDMLV